MLSVCSFCYQCQELINKGEFEEQDYEKFQIHLRLEHGWIEEIPR